MKYSLIVALLGSFAVSVLSVTEYVALGPVGLQVGPHISNPILKWAELRYDESASSISEVYFEILNATTPEVGAWFDLDLSKGGGKGLGLTAKVHKDKLYAYIEKATVADARGGCCADTMRIYDRTTGKYTEIDLDAMLSKIFPQSISFHHATHTFDVEEKDGVVYVWLMVQYSDPTLDEVPTNAAVVFSAVDGVVQKTKDGDAFFSFSQHIGTTSTALNETIFKVQYEKPSGKKSEEWHGNGILSFTTKAGVKLLAITHRMDAEAVIMKDPYTYGASDGGGSILQRFGTPHFGTAQRHHFGLPASATDWDGGCHNVFYTASTNTKALMGNETISLFVNSVNGGSSSFAYEFVLSLTEEKPDVIYTDRVFDTKFVSAACGFQAFAQGGARAFANGIFIVASGSVQRANSVLELIDSSGAKKDLPYPNSGSGFASLYDPFISVISSTSGN